MGSGHMFWWGLTLACVVWYSVMTVYVGIRGFADIKSMLRNLAEGGAGENAQE